MTSLYTRINVTIPNEIITDLRKIVPKRKRSKFVSSAIAKKIEDLKKKKALRTLSGSWDRAGGIKFSSDKELSLWRKNLWESFDRKISSK